MVFEDKESSGCSELLKIAYKETDNVVLEFTGGNKGLLKSMNKSDEYDLTLIYVDVSLENLNTVGIFKRLIKKTKVYRNVMVIPIISIEFILLRSLHYLNLLDLNNLRNIINYDEYLEFLNIKHKKDTYENLTKFVVSYCELKCLQREYFKYDCMYHDVPLTLKSEALVYSLPVWCNTTITCGEFIQYPFESICKLAVNEVIKAYNNVDEVKELLENFVLISKGE